PPQRRPWSLRVKVSRPGDIRHRSSLHRDHTPPTPRPSACVSASAPASPGRIFARVPCQKPRWQGKLLRLLSFADSFLVFGFEFMNYQLIPVGILHHRHVTARRVKRLGGESDTLPSQLVNCLLEV